MRIAKCDTQIRRQNLNFWKDTSILGGEKLQFSCSDDDDTAADGCTDETTAVDEYIARQIVALEQAEMQESAAFDSSPDQQHLMKRRRSAFDDQIRRKPEVSHENRHADHDSDLRHIEVADRRVFRYFKLIN